MANHAADGKKISHDVSRAPLAAGAHHLIGPLPGMLSPAYFRQSSGLIAVVGTSRCDVPGRVQRAERRPWGVPITLTLRRYAARTTQRAVPTRVIPRREIPFVELSMNQPNVQRSRFKVQGSR